MKAMLQMQKIDLETLRQAYDMKYDFGRKNWNPIFI
jgi:hypothetical protein